MRRLIIILSLLFVAFHIQAQDVALTKTKPVRMVRPESGITLFTKAYVENALDEWQRREENESQSHYRKRVTEANRQRLMPLLEDEARDEYLKIISKSLIINVDIIGYDDNAEMMILKERRFGRFNVNIPSDEVSYFEKSWADISMEPRFFIVADTIGLASVRFSLPNGKIYQYENPLANDSVYIGLNNVLSPIYVYGEKVRNGMNDGKFNDIDENIPVTDTVDNKTFVVIIANENYRNESKVKFAKNDAESFKNYCHKTFGIPKKNIRFVQNARLSDFNLSLQWLTGIAQRYGEDCKIIFYYVGHGTMSRRSKKSFFVPIDGYLTKERTCFSVDYLLKNLGAMPVKSVTLFIDASFNCYNRQGKVLVEELDNRKASQELSLGNVIAFFACQGNETAFQYEKKNHGVFTYFLLNEIQNHPTNLDFEALFYNVQSRVKTYTLSEYKTLQTPIMMKSY